MLEPVLTYAEIKRLLEQALAAADTRDDFHLAALVAAALDAVDERLSSKDNPE